MDGWMDGLDWILLRRLVLLEHLTVLKTKVEVLFNNKNKGTGGFQNKNKGTGAFNKKDRPKTKVHVLF